jgi:hypothetical protein
MSMFTMLAGRLAQVALVGPAVARMKRRAIRSAIGIALVGLCGTLGAIYLLAAVRFELEQYIGPLWAPVAIGGVLCLVALVAYLVLLKAPRRPQAEAAAETSSLGLPPDLAAPIQQLGAQVSSKPLQSIALAVAAGFAAAMVLRMVRQRNQRKAAPQSAAPPPRANGRAEPDGPWVREVVLRETERRRANGRGART